MHRPSKVKDVTIILEPPDFCGGSQPGSDKGPWLVDHACAKWLDRELGIPDNARRKGRRLVVGYESTNQNGRLVVEAVQYGGEQRWVATEFVNP